MLTILNITIVNITIIVITSIIVIISPPAPDLDLGEQTVPEFVNEFVNHRFVSPVQNILQFNSFCPGSYVHLW